MEMLVRKVIVAPSPLPLSPSDGARGNKSGVAFPGRRSFLACPGLISSCPFGAADGASRQNFWGQISPEVGDVKWEGRASSPGGSASGHLAARPVFDLLKRPRDRLRKTQMRPHPGPLPSDGRGRAIVSLVSYPGVPSVEGSQGWGRAGYLMPEREGGGGERELRVWEVRVES